VARGAGSGLDSAHVVDAGCGFGTNAVHLAQAFGPRRVTGVKVPAVRLAIARQRVADAGVADAVDFHLGSVTALYPFD